MIRNYITVLLLSLIMLTCTPAYATQGVLNERGSNTIEGIEGVPSEDNTSSTPLGIGGVFTGTAEDITNYAIIYVSIYTDQAGELSVQQSSDATNWDYVDTFAIPAATGKNFSINPHSMYFRVVYTNGAVGQTEMRLTTISKSVYGKPSSHAINEAISEVDDAELVKAVLSAQVVNDGFVNIGASESGNLKTTDAENGLAIAKGDVVGTSVVLKFGNAPDFDTTDLEITVWDGAEDGTAWELMEYVYSTTADIDSISSSSAGDTQDITIQGLDANYVLVNQTVTLTGQTRAPLATPLMRVFRAFNANGTDIVGHAIIYVNGALTDGVPDTNADIRAVIDPDHQQTEMALYTIPAGKTAYMRSWYSSTAGASRSSNYAVEMYSRELGGVWRLKHQSAIADSGTSSYQHEYHEPQKFLEKTDIEMKTEMFVVGGTAASVSAGFDIVLVDN